MSNNSDTEMRIKLIIGILAHEKIAMTGSVIASRLANMYRKRGLEVNITERHIHPLLNGLVASGVVHRIDGNQNQEEKWKFISQTK